MPAHDDRDYAFAKKYNLPIKEVISGGNISQKAYVDDGIMINSDRFDGRKNTEIMKEITEYAGEMDRAVNLFQKAVELSPGDVIARDRLGLVCRKVGNSEKAMESFEKAIRINPLYAPAYKHLGIIFKEKGDRAQAVKFLKKSLQLDPYNKRTIWELYKVYLRQDN